jgi:hypothetical protein
VGSCDLDPPQFVFEETAIEPVMTQPEPGTDALRWLHENAHSMSRRARTKDSSGPRNLRKPGRISAADEPPVGLKARYTRYT